MLRVLFWEREAYLKGDERRKRKDAHFGGRERRYWKLKQGARVEGPNPPSLHSLLRFASFSSFPSCNFVLVMDFRG